MKLLPINPKRSLNKAFLKQRPLRSEMDLFKQNLISLLSKMDEIEREENQKNHVRDFLLNTYYKETNEVNTKGTQDLVIHNGKDNRSSVGVIIEVKRPSNKGEWISPEKPNGKAFHELVLYYMRERIDANNIDIKYLIATNINEWYVFEASYFEKTFYNNKTFVKHYQEWRDKQKVTSDTKLFYNEIAKPFIDSLTNEVGCTYFNIKDYQTFLNNESLDDDKNLTPLLKILSPSHLLKVPFANDSNSLDKVFYTELLHLIGLTETKEGGRKLIQRHAVGNQLPGSLLENTIMQLDSHDKILRLAQPSQYGNTHEERLFNVGLELVITWLNRILFLKLLEAQMLTYHKGNKQYSFLNLEKINDYDELDKLFFRVLAKKIEDRDPSINKIFSLVPYLNSSLFEPTELEHQTLFINGLEDNIFLPYHSGSILSKDKKSKSSLTAIAYLFEFLNAYDFSSDSTGDIQEDNKRLINASVLGLIFEKINGYKDGSFFTPGFITMYMCRETIRRSVIHKFKEAGYEFTENANIETNFEELYDKIENRKEANKIINSLKICDPAVGSGHFLVSALNEIIAIKSDLKILSDREGKRLKEYLVEVVNDELVVTDEDGELFEYNPQNKESQRIQETLFHEKQTIIEDCLFGVDINPNSIKICRLRLWVELLKNAYYRSDNKQLETLPNIDINIKYGNSLISRFDLDADLKQALKKSKWTIDSYRLAVQTYRHAQGKEEKWEMERLIKDIKSDFRTEINKNDSKLIKINKLNGELKILTTQQSIFGMSDKEKKDFTKKIETLTAEIRRQEEQIEEIKNNKIYQNAFEWRFEFPEVLNNEGEFVGFDVVIGNPPYGIQFDLLEKIFIKSNYYSMEGDYDSYIYFFEKSFSLLKENAKLAFIVPNNLLIQKFGKKIRELILKDYNIEFIIDLGLGIFEEAVVPTVIIILNRQTINNHIVKFLFRPKDFLQNYQTINQNSFRENENLAFNIQINPRENNVLSKLKKDTLPLGKISEIKIGIECTPNYITDKPVSDFSKPLVRGRNFNRYSLQFENDPKYVEYKRELLHRAREERLFIVPRKIIIRQTGDSIVATLDENKLYAWKSVFVLLADENLYHLNFLLALLNSKAIDFFYQKLVGEEGRAFAQVKGVNLSVLPIKDITREAQQSFVDIVEKILKQKKIQPSHDTKELETEIDKMVYNLYNLSDEEIKIIEKI